MRPALLVGAVILVLLALWQFSKYVTVGAQGGFTHLVIALVCIVGAMGCGIGWILTKPKESMDDISITKI